MRIVSAAADYGNGYAFLDIGMPVIDGMQVTIERDAEKNCFLGPAGWQNTPSGIAAARAADNAPPNNLLLGPIIVDALKDGDFVTISVIGTSFNESDFWPPIPISGRKARGDGMIAPLPGSKVKAPSPAAPRLEANGMVMPDGQSSTLSDTNIPTDGSPPVPFFQTMLGRATIAVLAIVLLAGSSFLAWRYWPQDALDDLQARVENTANSIRDYITGPSAPPPTDWAGVLRDPNSTPEKLYQSSLDTREGAETQDLSRELLYQSALRGNIQAQKDYSRLYDPTITQTTGWEAQKNARTALEYYRKLQNGGDQAAASDIRRICDFLKPDIFTNAESRTAFNDFCS